MKERMRIVALVLVLASLEMFSFQARAGGKGPGARGQAGLLLLAKSMRLKRSPTACTTRLQAA
jgi:hypothetical protein